MPSTGAIELHLVLVAPERPEEEPGAASHHREVDDEEGRRERRAPVDAEEDRSHGEDDHGLDERDREPPEAEPEEDRADPGSGRDGPAQHPLAASLHDQAAARQARDEDEEDEVLRRGLREPAHVGGVCVADVPNADPRGRRTAERVGGGEGDRERLSGRASGEPCGCDTAGDRRHDALECDLGRERLIRRRAHHVARAGGAAMRDGVVERAIEHDSRRDRLASGRAPKRGDGAVVVHRHPVAGPHRMGDPRGERAVVELHEPDVEAALPAERRADDDDDDHRQHDHEEQRRRGRGAGGAGRPR